MSNLFARLVGAYLSAALLTACGGGSSSLTPGAESNASQRAVSSFARQTRPHPANLAPVYAFKRIPDGSWPEAALIGVNGTIYGTTFAGGSHDKGTVFKISTSGAESVLYSFGARRSDGVFPWTSSVVDVKGVLYGTTESGGRGSGCPAGSYGGCGTVYKVTTSGTESVLHSFNGGTDGANPYATLIAVNGTLYGTTNAGGSGCGSFGCGTVFKITPSGKETVLYRFMGGKDGAFPNGLLNVNGTLYGTTYSGGGRGCAYHQGCGTIFAIGTSGMETVLYGFKGGTDGASPLAALTDVSGTLYGTTLNGGASGVGTVFEIATSGAGYQSLYSFRGGTDGATPDAVGGLTKVNGTLYGTTFHGGGSRCDHGGGCGTIFAITTSGTERIVYAFENPHKNGKYPEGALTDINGTLYGTTVFGGPGCSGRLGCGTVFKVSP